MLFGRRRRIIFSLLSSFLISFLVQAEDFKKFNSPIDGKLPYFEKKDITPIWLTNSSGVKKKGLLQLNSHQLRSQYKKSFGSKQMNGKVNIVNFFFASCPGYCPTIMKNIKYAHNEWKGNSQVNFVSYSVTPKIDTEENLRKYSVTNEIANTNWFLLTGDREKIYTIAREQLLADLAIDLNKPEDQFVHSENVYLLDKDLYVRGIYNSTMKKKMLKLAKDIEKLK